jgi:hypothetical protein
MVMVYVFQAFGGNRQPPDMTSTLLSPTATLLSLLHLQSVLLAAAAAAVEMKRCQNQ